MDFAQITNTEIYTWVILPFLIFISRIFDQSIGTLRLIYAAKGYKNIAPFLGFFEALIWLLAVMQIMKHLDNVLCYITYAAGFAMGNYVGMLLEEKVSIGTVIVRIIPKVDATELVEALRSNNFGVTSVDGEGKEGKKKIIFSILKRKEIEPFVKLVNQYNPNAFYSIEDVRSFKEGYFRIKHKKKIFTVFHPFTKKGK